MGEYGREQRNQLSRGIADSKPGSGQLKEFVDNRTKYTTNSAMPNSTQYKHSNSTNLFPVQLSRIWSSKGNIIRSVELPVEKKKPGTFNRGQIVGGIEHKEGTPGTSFANDIVNMLDKGSPLRSLGWKGGHLLKHQWGGGKTTGNVVAWPSVAENSWGLNFENRIESIIQKTKGIDIAVGVSWLREDEHISQDAIDNTLSSFVQKALNVKRGELNRKLSYIPICVAGTYTALDENRESNNHLIDSDCTKVFDVVDSVKNNLTTRLTEHFKGEESKYPDLLGIKMQGFDRKNASNSRERDDMEKKALEDEEMHKGTYGNVKIEKTGCSQFITGE